MSQLQKLRENAPFDPPQMLAATINRLAVGSLNSIGSVTLTNGGSTTTLMDNTITRGCKLFLSPTTADAATVTGLWADPTSIPAIGGAITLTHSAVAKADLNFDYMVVR